jgi:hypothetical protein
MPDLRITPCGVILDNYSSIDQYIYKIGEDPSTPLAWKPAIVHRIMAATKTIILITGGTSSPLLFP